MTRKFYAAVVAFLALAWLAPPASAQFTPLNAGTLTGDVTKASGQTATTVVKIGGVNVGNAATKNVGTTAGTVAAGDDSRIVNAAPTNSPTFTGTPAVPTAAPGTNTTQAASTAFVTAAVAGGGSSPCSAFGTTGGTCAQGNDSRITGAAQVGSSNVFTQGQTVKLNSASLPSSITGAGMTIGAADGVVSRYEAKSFGTIGAFTTSRYDGTAASPTAVQAGDQVGGFNAHAYDGTNLQGPIGSFRIFATDTITSGHWGSKACIATSATNTTTMADSLCQWQSGGITIGSPTGGDKGAGTLNASLYQNGTALGTAATAVTGTSGHNLPFLDGANTFSATQTLPVSDKGGQVYNFAAYGAVCDGVTISGSSISGTTLSVGAVQHGALAAGMGLYGQGVTAGTTIVSGSGLTWTVSASQTVSSETMQAGTDNGSAWNTLMTTVMGASGAGPGGTILVPGHCIIATAPNMIPNSGTGTIPTQAPLRITGMTEGAPGVGTVATSYNPKVGNLDFESNSASTAWIDTRGGGILTIDNITLSNSGNYCAPFVHTTNTVLQIHNTYFGGGRNLRNACNDAIVLGGGDSSFSTAFTSGFAGYGTGIHHNGFSQIDRALYVKGDFANGSDFSHNYIGSDNGTSRTSAISTCTQASPAVCVVPDLGFVTAATFPINISGGTGNWTGINGQKTATVVDSTHVSVGGVNSSAYGAVTGSLVFVTGAAIEIDKGQANHIENNIVEVTGYAFGIMCTTNCSQGTGLLYNQIWDPSTTYTIGGVRALGNLNEVRDGHNEVSGAMGLGNINGNSISTSPNYNAANNFPALKVAGLPITPPVSCSTGAVYFQSSTGGISPICDYGYLNYITANHFFGWGCNGTAVYAGDVCGTPSAANSPAFSWKSTSTGGYSPNTFFWNPSLANGETIYVGIGKSATANNLLTLALKYTSSGSTSNTAAMGMNGVAFDFFDGSAAGGLQIHGTPTNDNAAAGFNGELGSSVVASGSAVSLTTATVANVTSVSLTAGDWDCTGSIDFVLSGTTASVFKGGISTTSATLGGQDTGFSLPLATTTLSDTLTHPLPVVRQSFSSTTTVYLVGRADFSAGTATQYGTLRCRRVR